MCRVLPCAVCGHVGLGDQLQGSYGSPVAFLPGHVWTGGQLGTGRFVMSLKVFKLKSGSSHLCKVPFAVPSPLAAPGVSDGLFWGVWQGFSGLQEWTSSGSQSRMLEHRCLLLLRESDFCAWSGKKKVVFCSENAPGFWFGDGKVRAEPGGLKEVVAWGRLGRWVLVALSADLRGFWLALAAAQLLPAVGALLAMGIYQSPVWERRLGRLGRQPPASAHCSTLNSLLRLVGVSWV